MAAAPPALPSTPLFAQFVEVANSTPADAVPKILSRVLSSIATHGASALRAEEHAAVATSLAAASTGSTPITPTHVHVFITGLAYVYDHAAAYGLKAATLLTLLGDAGVNEAMATAIATTWANESAAVLSTMRSSVLGLPRVCEGASWRVHVETGSHAHTHGRSVGADITFHLSEEVPTAKALGITRANAAAMRDASLAEGTDASRARVCVCEDVLTRAQDVTVAMDKNGLVALLEQLDTIQQQIDALSA